MGRDRREDEGQYYPGGKVIPTTPHQGGGSIVLDDTVTETSANGVKSSGIWTFVRGLLDALTLQWSKVTDKPTTFPPSAHMHTQSDVTGLFDALAAKANKSDFSPSTPASYVTNFVQQSDALRARIKSVAQSLIRTAFANFDPEEHSFADLVNILKNIGE